jgi:hypothetical protein
MSDTVARATDDRLEVSRAYASVFSESAEVQTVLDDLVNWSTAIADPNTKAGATLAVHRIYSMRSYQRRATRKAGR